MIDWTNSDYTAAGGQYQALIESVTVVCADPTSPPSGTTSYVYGSNSSTNTPSISFSSAITTINSTSGASGASNSSSSSGGSQAGGASAQDVSSSSGSSGGSGSSGAKVGIIAGSIIGGLAALVLGALLIRCCVRTGKGSPSAKGGYAFTAQGSNYRSLNAPAPHAAAETHALPNLHYDGGRYD